MRILRAAVIGMICLVSLAGGVAPGSEGLIFHSEVIAHVRNALAVHKGRAFSVPEFKDWTQMSRKYAIPVLEYLDREKVTRRVGDQRVVL